jgi:hypothetical protein
MQLTYAPPCLHHVFPPFLIQLGAHAQSMHTHKHHVLRDCLAYNTIHPLYVHKLNRLLITFNLAAVLTETVQLQNWHHRTSRLNTVRLANASARPQIAPLHNPTGSSIIRAAAVLEMYRCLFIFFIAFRPYLFGLQCRACSR